MQGEAICECKAQLHHCKLIVITGGPGAGKTAVLEMAKKVFCNHIQVVPEAATILFSGGFWRKSSDVARQCAQRAIFAIQNELQTIVVKEQKSAIGLCDRGTLDGLAYWPDNDASFFSDLKTSHDQELSKYSAVIHLRTPLAEEGYNQSNHVRVEKAEDAKQIDERILKAWERHPEHTVISASTDFIQKMRVSLEIIRDKLPSCCKNHQINL